MTVNGDQAKSLNPLHDFCLHKLDWIVCFWVTLMDLNEFFGTNYDRNVLVIY